MPSAAAIVAWSPVPHACWMSNAGVYGDSALPRTHSRIRLKSGLCLSTAPPITAPSFSPSRLKRSMSPPSAAVNMSWLEAFAYAPSDRANGILLPPRTATRRLDLLAMGAILLTVLTLEEVRSHGYRSVLTNRPFGARILPRQPAGRPATRDAAPLLSRRSAPGG